MELYKQILSLSRKLQQSELYQNNYNAEVFIKKAILTLHPDDLKILGIMIDRYGTRRCILWARNIACSSMAHKKISTVIKISFNQ